MLSYNVTIYLLTVRLCTYLSANTLPYVEVLLGVRSQILNDVELKIMIKNESKK